MTREEFFNSLNTGAKWDVGVSIARTNPLPLDANSIFESIEALEAYITTNPLSFPGQIVSVLGESEVAAYIILSVGTSGTYQKLAASSASGDIAQDVATLQQQVSAISSQLVPASGTTQGFLSAADFTKLQSIETGAQANKIETITVNGTAVTITDKTAAITDVASASAVSTLTNRVTTIESKIPSDAGSEGNAQLATKSFVNSTVQNMAARFITPTADGSSQWASLAALNAEGATYYYAGEATTPTANDYAIFLKTVDGAQEQWRASYQKPADGTGAWVEQYKVGSAFTDAQTTALNSGITSAGVTQIETNKTDIATLTTTVNGMYTNAQVDAKVEEVVAPVRTKANANETAITGLTTDVTTLKTTVGDSTSGLVKDIADQASLIASLRTDVDNKQTAAQVNALIANATIAGGNVNGAVSEASKVTNALTIGDKTFDGSEAVTVTATDLGALTEIVKATEDALGGIKIGYTQSTTNRAVMLDEDGKAYVNVPAAMSYTAAVNGGLELTDGAFSIKDGGVTDAKIANVNISKVQQTEGDFIVLDGGISSSFS